MAVYLTEEQFTMLIGRLTAASNDWTDWSFAFKRAVRAGVRSIEHGSLMDDEGIELMVAHGTTLGVRNWD